MLISFCDTEQGREYIGSLNLKNFVDTDELVDFFKKEYQSISLNNKYEPLILIILSQPDQKEITKVNSCAWDKILVRKGIRANGSFFSTKEELKLLLDSVRLQYLEEMRDSYLENFKDYPPLELEKLAVWSGISIDKLKEKFQKSGGNIGKRNNLHMPFPPLQTPGRLITYRGGNEGFIKLVKSLKYSKSMVAVVDSDLLKPSFDQLFSLPVKHNEKGINSLITGLDRGVDSQKLIKETMSKLTKNFHILLGNYSIYNYEHYKTEQFRKLISVLTSHYDISLFKLTESIFDELAMMVTHRADYNIICSSRCLSDLRYNRQILTNLKEKQQIPLHKISIYKERGMEIDHLMYALFKDSYEGVLKSPKKLYKILKRRTKII